MKLIAEDRMGER